MKEEIKMPCKKKFNGKEYVLSAATRHGTTISDTKGNQEYLKTLGFSTRCIKVGRDYYVYGRKK